MLFLACALPVLVALRGLGRGSQPHFVSFPLPAPRGQRSPVPVGRAGLLQHGAFEDVVDDFGAQGCQPEGDRSVQVWSESGRDGNRASDNQHSKRATAPARPPGFVTGRTQRPVRVSRQRCWRTGDLGLSPRIHLEGEGQNRFHKASQRPPCVLPTVHTQTIRKIHVESVTGDFFQGDRNRHLFMSRRER